MHERELNAFLVGRALLDRADAFTDGTAPGAIGAVVLYDLAVETVGKAAEVRRPASSFPGRGYKLSKSDLAQPPRAGELSVPRMLDHLLAAVRIEATNEALLPGPITDAHRLHARRNSVQHEGVPPSDDAVTLSRLQAREFLQWVAQAFHDVPLASISRASLVQSDEVRERILAAEDAAEKGNYMGAGVELGIALELARQDLRSGDTYQLRRSFRLGSGRRAIESLEVAIAGDERF